jgi:very-short-patch-repair endonuclease
MGAEPDKRIARARRLRVDLSPPEVVFWSLVRSRRCGGLKFRRQHPVGPYTVDFFCPDAAMIVELDGQTHRASVESDRERDGWLEREGFLVVRVSVSEFMKNPEGTVGAIGRVALRRMEELKKAGR